MYSAVIDFPQPSNKPQKPWGQEAGSQTGITPDYTRWPGGGDASICWLVCLQEGRAIEGLGGAVVQVPELGTWRLSW